MHAHHMGFRCEMLSLERDQVHDPIRARWFLLRPERRNSR
jgi:hypothetical protein